MKSKSPSEIREKKKRIAEKLAIRAIKPKKIKHKFWPLRIKCDNLFWLYIRFVRDKDKWCITCGSFGENDCWHYQVRQHMNTRYSEMNTAKQCVHCNKYHLWEQVKFGRVIDETYWQGTAEALEIFARQPSSIKQDELLEIYNKYYEILVKEKVHIPPSYIVKKYLWNQTK